ncbi:hypothetical protein [Streptomyces sp. NPDC004135]
MDYWLDVKTADPNGFKAAIEADASATGGAYAIVSDDGIGLHEPKESKRRGDKVELLSLLLTIPVGITIDVAADQIKSWLSRNKVREATIRWVEETVDDDGNVTTNEREQRVEIDES